MSWYERKRVELTGGVVAGYFEGTTTTLYVAKTFSQGMNTMEVSNDSSSDTIQISYDGATLAGSLLPGEVKLFPVNGKKVLYIKSTSGGASYRIWGT